MAQTKKSHNSYRSGYPGCQRFELQLLAYQRLWRGEILSRSEGSTPVDKYLASRSGQESR
jgi:hypothetical protein